MEETNTEQKRSRCRLAAWLHLVESWSNFTYTQVHWFDDWLHFMLSISSFCTPWYTNRHGIHFSWTRNNLPSKMLMTTRMNKHNEFQPTYAKGGTWLSLFSHSITLCARAIRTILNHAPIGEYGGRFHPQEPVACPCGESDLETRTHILTECPRFTENRVTLSMLRRPH